MKKLLFIFSVVMFTACSTQDISDVNSGMTSAEVIDIAGEPTEKVEMPLDIEWWVYEESKVLLIFENDTVSRVTSEEEIQNSLKDHEQGMNDIQKEIEKITN